MNTFIRFVDFNLYPHTGWQVCNECDKICEENQKSFVIEKTVLHEMFDNGKFKVLRKNGDIETEWYITGNGLRFDISDDYTVTINNEEKSTPNTLQKRIYVSVLQEWQLL